MEGLDTVDIISAAWQLLTARRDFHCALARYIFPDRAVAHLLPCDVPKMGQYPNTGQQTLLLPPTASVADVEVNFRGR